MNDNTDVKVCAVDMGDGSFMKELQKAEAECSTKWKEESSTKFAMKLLSHGEPEKAEIVNGLVSQTFETAFKMGIAAFLAYATKNAKTIQPNGNGMAIPVPGVGQA